MRKRGQSRERFSTFVIRGIEAEEIPNFELMRERVLLFHLAFLSSSDGYLLCHICTGQSIQRRYSANNTWGWGHTHARNGADSRLVLSNLLHISSYHQS